MRRDYYDKRIEVERVKQVSIFSLKAYGVLDQDSVCTIWWDDNKEDSVRIATDIQAETVRFSYNLIDSDSEEAWEQSSGCWLTTTPCNLGGHRYWFTCLCGRRVGVLYRGNDGFRCRHCYNLTYESRNENHRGVNSGFSRAYRLARRAEKLQSKAKRLFYSGQFTKKYQQIFMLNSQFKQCMETLNRALF